MERTIISYNKPAHMNALARLNAMRRIIDELKAGYVKFSDDTEADPLEKESLIEIMRNGPSAVESLIDLHVEKQKRPLQKYYLEACFQALEKHLDPILKKIENWRDQSTRRSGITYFPAELEDPGTWPWTDDLALLIDKNFEEKIKPYFEISIHSELDHELLAKYQAVVTAYNALMDLANTNDIRIPKSLNILFRTEGMMQVDQIRSHPEVFLPSQTNRELEEQYGRR